MGENTEKNITFSVPVKEQLDSSRTIALKSKFIDSIRFMSSKLSRLVNNLSEKCRDKNWKYECEFKGFKNNKLSYDCKECRKKQLNQ